MHCLKKMKPEGHEIADEKTAEEVRSESKRPRFKFSMLGIKPGTEIVYRDGKIKAKVVDDSKIEFKGETMSLSKAVSIIRKKDAHYPGPDYWYYKGKALSELRKIKEK